MNIAIDNDRLRESLAKRVHTSISRSHNFIEVCMFGVSRRTLTNLLAALNTTKFKCKESDGCVYYLEDGTVAERFGESVELYRMDRVQHLAMKPHVAKIKGLFTDLPRVALTIATKTRMDAETQTMQQVTQRQFVTKQTFVNSRGYEYIVSVSTPCAAGNFAQALAAAEAALMDSTKQRNEFRIRFNLKDYNHSCYYYCMNVIWLFIQIFSPKLQFSLS